MRGLRLIPEDTKVNFMGMHRIAFIFSLAILLSSIMLLAENGLNFGVDFTGGTLIEIKTPQVPDLPQLRKELNAIDLGAVSIQEFGAPEDLLIRMGEQPGGSEAQKAAIDKIKSVLSALYDAPVDYRRTEFVGPQVGKELKLQGLYAVLFSLGGILAYIWFRFEWQFGVASIIALAHDSMATLGFFALMQFEFNLSTVAAVLTIAGYSINDTVVVFDRIRENLRKYKKMAAADLFNMSINQTLTRTIITSFTTLIALIALYIFGGEVIRGFVNALIFGIVVGTYSSIFVASPVLLYLNLRPSSQKADKDKEA